MPSEKLRPRQPLGRDTAHGISCGNPRFPDQARHIGTVHKPNREGLAFAKMQCDVAAIVDIGPIQISGLHHGTEDLLCDGTSHSSHRRDEVIRSKGSNRIVHPVRDISLQETPIRSGRFPQFRKLLAEFVEQSGEAASCSFISCKDHLRSAMRLHDQIDRAVLHVKPPAIRQPSDLREPCQARSHGRDLGSDCCRGSWRTSVLPFNDANGRT
jgi:hypothetical protein